MRLVYDNSGTEVKVGDIVTINKVAHKITFFREPHKVGSSGKVSVTVDGGVCNREYYVSVIGATWIEREDR